jgi:hypothetical protein
MRQILTVAATALLFSTQLSCSVLHHGSKTHAPLPGTWQSSPIVVDGQSKDWPSPYPNYDSKARIAYATSNDKENLYITLETGDEMTQMKILKQGLVVSIDTGGGKNTPFNINFPLQSEVDLADLPRQEAGLKKDNMRYEDKQREQRISQYVKEANQFSLDGFIACNGVFMPKQTTPCGISVRMGIDEFKELVWEAVVPLRAIYNRNDISATDAGKPLSVAFSIKGFRKPESKSSPDNSNAGGGGMNSGMGTAGANSGMRGAGSRGGGGRGGRTGQAESPLQHLYESTKTWKFFGLAWNQ